MEWDGNKWLERYSIPCCIAFSVITDVVWNEKELSGLSDILFHADVWFFPIVLELITAESTIWVDKKYNVSITCFVDFILFKLFNHLNASTEDYSSVEKVAPLL